MVPTLFSKSKRHTIYLVCHASYGKPNSQHLLDKAAKRGTQLLGARLSPVAGYPGRIQLRTGLTLIPSPSANLAG